MSFDRQKGEKEAGPSTNGPSLLELISLRKFVVKGSSPGEGGVKTNRDGEGNILQFQPKSPVERQSNDGRVKKNSSR